MRRLRDFFLILLMPRLVTWAADALERVCDDDGLLDALDPYQRAHLLEASASSARTFDCVRYVFADGRRVEDLATSATWRAASPLR